MCILIKPGKAADFMHVTKPGLAEINLLRDPNMVLLVVVNLGRVDSDLEIPALCLNTKPNLPTFQCP